MKNIPLVFENHPDIDNLGKTFAGGRYFSEESLAFHLPIFCHAKLLVATMQWRIVGAIMYQLVQDSFNKKVLFPFFIEVLPEFRKKKIGSGLLQKVEEIHRGEISQISASVTGLDISSQKMFLNAGFRPIDHNRYIKNLRK